MGAGDNPLENAGGMAGNDLPSSGVRESKSSID